MRSELICLYRDFCLSFSYLCKNLLLYVQATEESQATVSEQDKVQELLAQRQRENTQRIEQQDSAPQAELVAGNLQASTAAVKFEVFGQTQEAINGEPPWLVQTHSTYTR